MFVIVGKEIRLRPHTCVRAQMSKNHNGLDKRENRKYICYMY